MASVTFANTTLWSDSGTGVGPLVWEADLAAERWDLGALIAGGFVAQPLGDEPGLVLVGCDYSLSSSELSALIATAEGVRGNTGTLAVAPGQSFARCILMRHRLARKTAHLLGNGTVKYSGQIQFLFQRLS